jgi:2-polyprenyl-6-methoxyphenol hydroxylase-like FAD-dependent oxidoreductase
MSKSSTLGREAIVIGAGMGGLAAVRVLSDHFERVTVLERDDLQANANPRAGVPQGKHLHALLAGGQRALEELFPGFTEDLDRVGAVRIRSGLDVLLERPGFDPFPQRDSGVVSSALTRPQLEQCVRRRVEAIANVRFERGARVLSLVTSTDGKSIQGVKCQREGKTDTLHADFVVDASGTGELTLAALRAMGISEVPETTIGVDIAYSTAVFDIPDDAPTDWKGVMHLPAAPETSRSALMFPIEGRRWILSLGGRHDEHPPGDEAGFREYTGTLRTKRIANAIASAKMVAGVERFRFNESRLRHFERLATFPTGLLPIADSICRFNPVFGQGMSVASQEARALGEELAKVASEGGSLTVVWKPFFQRVAQIVEAPWALAAVPDFIFPRTVGKRPDDFEMSLRFGMALTKAMAKHPDIHKLAVEIQHLLKPRSAFMAPNVIEHIKAEMAGG